jgi:hypothetical protein
VKPRLHCCDVLSRLRLPDRPPAPTAGGYRELVRDPALARLLALNYLFVISSVALVNGLFPVFAKNQATVSEDTIGFLFLLNSVLIIGAQCPSLGQSRAADGDAASR